MNMEKTQALVAFGALSQATRLQIVRALVVAGSDGLAAGAIGQAVGASSSSTSFHLSNLEQAGLVKSRREHRSIIYTANYESLSGLIGFLMKDCCQGRPEICIPASLVADACCVPNKGPAHVG
jgi:DNA-binding transcriptional ArsR family regulator